MKAKALKGSIPAFDGMGDAEFQLMMFGLPMQLGLDGLCPCCAPKDCGVLHVVSVVKGEHGRKAVRDDETAAVLIQCENGHNFRLTFYENSGGLYLQMNEL